jgi:multidrug resistance protein
MTTLFLVVVLDLIGFGMIIPVFPFYAERVGVDPAAVIFFLGLYSLGQLVGAPAWGALSDRIGRRPVLLATLVANVLANLMLAMSHEPWSLAVSRVVSGLAAGNISAAYAYVTDITDDRTRPKALGLLGAAFGIGFVLGPAFGGLLAGADPDGTHGLARVAYGAAALSALGFVLTWLRLPETLSAEQRSGPRPPRVSPMAYLARPVLRELLLSAIVVVAAVAMMQSTLALWAADELRATAATLGWVYGFIGVVSTIVQAGLTGPLVRRFGPAVLLRAGTAMAAVALLFIPISASIAQLLVWLGLFGVGSAIVNPSYSQLVATAAAPTERGAVLGAYQGASSLGRVIGPFAASGIATALPLRWPFLAGGVLMLVGLLMQRGVAAPSPQATADAPA